MTRDVNINLFEIDEEQINNIKLAIRYGYLYRKNAQTQCEESSKINYCLPDVSEILIWLGYQILSGITWDTIKYIGKSIYNKYKNNNIIKDIDKETENILSDEEELYKFCEYIKEFENGLTNISEEEYKYIEEEMMADFCSEMETEIYTKEKRMVTIEERIQIRKTARIKIQKITQRENNIYNMSKFINKLEVARGGQTFTLVNSNEIFCHMCDHELAQEKFNDRIFDIGVTAGLPEYNGARYISTTNQKFQPLVYIYYLNNNALCYIVSQDFILFYKLACDIQDNKIIAYYKINENGERDDIIIIDNDCFYIKTSYLKEFLRTINKSLLYNIEINIKDKENIESLIEELEQKGMKVTKNYPYLNCRYILQNK